MKNLLALFTCTLLAFGAFAQDAEPVKERRGEIYVKPTGLFNFSGLQLEYKRQLKSGNYFTFGIDGLNIRHTQDLSPTPSTTSYNNNYLAAISLGCERRKQVIEKLDFIYGPNLMLGYQFASTENTYTSATNQKIVSGNYNSIYSVGPGYKVGLLYTIADKFLVGGQFIPTLGLAYSHAYQKRTPAITPPGGDQSRLDINFNVFNNSRLLIGYRF